MSTGASGPSAGTSASKESHWMTFPPVVYLGLGIIVGLAFIAGTSMQILTNEAFIINQPVGVLHPDLLIFRQLGNIWSGNMTVTTSLQYIYGWGVQIVLLIRKIGIERAQTHIAKKYGGVASERAHKEAQLREGIWFAVSWLIIIFDSVADWQYAAQLDWPQRLLFTGVTFLTSFYFGTASLHLIFAGISDMKGK